MTILLFILSILITILLIIGVHEFAHCKMAQWLGVRVLTFSIGFGKTIFSRTTRNGTEYRIGLIPLGGYVQMLNEDDDPVNPEDLPYSFSRQPAYKKALIILAGPLSNLILAFFLYWFALTVGFTTYLPIIGKVEKHSIAEKAHLRENSIITEVNHKRVDSWGDVVLIAMREYGNDSRMHVQTMQQETPFTKEDHVIDLSDWTMNELNPSPLESLGIEPYFPSIPVRIHVIQPDSPASHSPLKTSDEFLFFKKTPVKDWRTLLTLIHEHPEEWISVTVKRGEQTLTFPVLIGKKGGLFFSKPYGYLGISPPPVTLPSFMKKHVQYDWMHAFLPAFERTQDMSVLNLLLFGKMLTGNLSLQSLSGPITIAESINEAFMQGWIEFVLFLAFLNVAIGIVNLLPIPALDGGHLFILLIEVLRQRAFLPETRARIHYAGFLILFFLMTHALLNDFLRL